jgi:hypothetical protein
MTPLARAAALSCVAFASACATAHEPAPSPRVAVVVHGGGAYYVANGRETPIGPLGGELASVVGADAEAVRFARRARAELAVGVPAYLAGVAAVVVGVAVGKPAGWALAGGGAAAAATGLGLLGAGAVNAVDAVNVYNDHVTPRP